MILGRRHLSPAGHIIARIDGFVRLRNLQMCLVMRSTHHEPRILSPIAIRNRYYILYVLEAQVEGRQRRSRCCYYWSVVASCGVGFASMIIAYCVGFASMIIAYCVGFASKSHTALGVASMSHTALGVASMIIAYGVKLGRGLPARGCYVRVGVGSAVSSRLLLSG